MNLIYNLISKYNFTTTLFNKVAEKCSVNKKNRVNKTNVALLQDPRTIIWAKEEAVQSIWSFSLIFILNTNITDKAKYFNI